RAVARRTFLQFAPWQIVDREKRFHHFENGRRAGVALPVVLDFRAGDDVPVHLPSRTIARAAPVSFEPGDGQDRSQLSVLCRAPKTLADDRQIRAAHSARDRAKKSASE